jgi:hypothetical protein
MRCYSARLESEDTAGTQIKPGRQRAAHNLLILMEVAIEVEPMNKGFAVIKGHLTLSVMERYSRMNTGFLRFRCKLISLHKCR